MEMIKMYRDMLNGTLDNFEDVDFKGIINREILRVKANKQLWTNFVTNRGYISMDKKTFFKNIEDTLDEWEEFGYWYFIGKGNCPKHENYSSEMRSQGIVSREMSKEREELYYMGMEDANVKSASRKSKTSSPKSVSRKSKTSSPKSASRKSKSLSPNSASSPKSATRKSKSSSPKSASRRSKSSSPKSATRRSKSSSPSPKSATRRRKSSAPKSLSTKFVSHKSTQ
jgi:hypothetical protein